MRNRLVVLDLEPDTLESALLSIVTLLSQPAGSTGAVRTAIVQEWEMARLSPGFGPFLPDRAMRAGETAQRSRGEGDPALA